MTYTEQHKCKSYCGSDCGCGCEESNKRTATLTFKREQLLYDIRGLGFVEGDIMSDEQQDAKHQTQDIGECGNLDRVTRLLNLGVSEVAEALYAYTKKELPEGESILLDDTLEEPDTYTIVLSVPSEFSGTTLRLLRDLIHEYLVCKVMGEWLSITKPDAAANWLAKAESALGKVKETLGRRMNGVLRPLNPF